MENAASSTTFETFKPVEGATPKNIPQCDENQLRYDIFHNDSLMVGKGKDAFEVNDCGQMDSVTHQNLPEFQRYYVFIVRKIST